MTSTSLLSQARFFVFLSMGKTTLKHQLSCFHILVLGLIAAIGTVCVLGAAVIVFAPGGLPMAFAKPTVVPVNVAMVYPTLPPEWTPVPVATTEVPPTLVPQPTDVPTEAAFPTEAPTVEVFPTAEAVHVDAAPASNMDSILLNSGFARTSSLDYTCATAYACRAYTDVTDGIAGQAYPNLNALGLAILVGQGYSSANQSVTVVLVLTEGYNLTVMQTASNLMADLANDPSLGSETAVAGGCNIKVAVDTTGGSISITVMPVG